MNSYTENLRSNVVTVLQILESHKKKIKFQLDTAKITADYAKDASRDAAEILATTNQNCKHQSEIVKQVLVNKASATDVSASADQLKVYTPRAVSNSSVAAANVQIAANAIVRLAGDAGSIFSIVNASDYGSEIYRLFNLVNEYMKDTAFTAESVSQRAMEVSVSTSEITGFSLADAAKKTDEHIKAFLDLMQSDLAVLQTTFTIDTANRATAFMAERQAKGMLETISSANIGAKRAYDASNKELNLDLQIKNQTGNSFEVQFDSYTVPFSEVEDVVESYAVFLVKENMKATFSLPKAEALLLAPRQRISISANNKEKRIKQLIDSAKLLDNDGEKMKSGESYVVFVLTVFSEYYKKTISNFDDCLSAPTEGFTLINEKDPDDSRKQGSVSSLKGNRLVLMEKLANDISEAQQQLTESQVKVDVLETKLASCQAHLQAATDTRKKAQTSNDQFMKFLADSQNLAALSKLCLNQATEANKATLALASVTKTLIDKLIYSTQVLNKSANAVIRQKALNPLISDELVALVGKAETDANNAVALALVALSAVFAAQASMLETKQTASITYKQAAKLLEILEGHPDKENDGSLRSLLHHAMEGAAANYEKRLDDQQDATAQLNVATVELNKIQIELNSS